ncbi:MAG: class I SAM-dependent methyltransferase [Planctomycetia bacterium]|nr:class I SAM-dependent methyltransferase [Planctomycetia bacterium]
MDTHNPGYWNRVADEKEFTTSLAGERFRQLVPQEAKILDVGCGYGRTLQELHSLGYSCLYGVDFAEKMIERGRKNLPFLSLQVALGQKLPFPEESFDAVLLLAVLTCIPDNHEQEKLLQEIYRILKPGGILYINDFLLNEDARNRQRYHEGVKKYGIYGLFELPEGVVLRHHEENYLREILALFHTLEWENVVFSTMNGHLSQGISYFGQKTPQH